MYIQRKYNCHRSGAAGVDPRLARRPLARLACSAPGARAAGTYGRRSRRSYDGCVRLRLYHHSDGARVAYRELGAGPPLPLLHSGLLSHKEWEPAVEPLAERFRVVLPDLPLHGDSEDHPRHPYTLDWFAEVLGGFSHEVLGARPMLAGHDAGAEIVLHAVRTGSVRPSRLVLMNSRMHASGERTRLRSLWRASARAAAVPGLDR